jgi:hypothetical protein
MPFEYSLGTDTDQHPEQNYCHKKSFAEATESIIKNIMNL